MLSGGNGQNLVGQASITNVQVGRPAAGQTATYDAQPGETFVINFDAASAVATVEGDNLVLTLADGGRIVFTGGADPDLAQDGAPMFEIDGELRSLLEIAIATLGSGGLGIQDPDLELIALIVSVSSITPTVLVEIGEAVSESVLRAFGISGADVLLSATIGFLGGLADGATVGGDVIAGDAGDGLILADVLSKDLVVDDPVVLVQVSAPTAIVPANSADGTGREVLENLIDDAFFANSQDAIDLLQDPAKIAAYDLRRESVADGESSDDGDDTTGGGGGNDTILGREGNDAIIGGSGSELIDGGGDADVVTLSADGETDTLSYHSLGGTADTVAGFNAGTPGGGGDLVDISDLLDSGSFPGGSLQDAIDGDYVQVSDAGGNAVISLDAGGTGAFTHLVILNGIDLGADASALDDNIIV